MTTIAYKDGILAGDTRAYSGDKQPIGDKHKVFKVHDLLIGVSSSVVGAPTAFMNWLLNAIKDNVTDLGQLVADKEHSLQALVIDKDRNVYLWNDGVAFTGPITTEFCAIGSGEQSAYMAMLLGKTAEEAVKLTFQVDHWTGGKVETVTHDG